MNDYYFLVRHRQNLDEAQRLAHKSALAHEALGDQKARPRWPRFDLLTYVRRLLPKAGGLPQPIPPCSDSPLSAR